MHNPDRLLNFRAYLNQTVFLLLPTMRARTTDNHGIRFRKVISNGIGVTSQMPRDLAHAPHRDVSCKHRLEELPALCMVYRPR
jgi:hypothetical protein